MPMIQTFSVSSSGNEVFGGPKVTRYNPGLGSLTVPKPLPEVEPILSMTLPPGSFP